MTTKFFKQVKINPEKDFDGNVFGADWFRKHWPALETDEGIILRQFGPDGWWYIWDTENNLMVHDSAFFTDEDMEYLIEVKSSNGVEE